MSDDKGETIKVFNPLTQYQVLKLTREGPSHIQMGKKRTQNLESRRAMNKEMINSFLLLPTLHTSISQIPPSTLEMVESKNFIQISIPHKEMNF